MILQGLGALCIFLSASWIGKLKGERYVRRYEDLRHLIHALTWFETALLERRLPLNKACYELSERARHPVSLLFQEMATALEHGMGMAASQCWNQALHAASTTWCFQKLEWDALQAFGATLGSTNHQDQRLQFKLLQEQLALAEKEAYLDEQRFAKMYARLGILMGISLVILLL